MQTYWANINLFMMSINILYDSSQKKPDNNHLNELENVLTEGDKSTNNMNFNYLA